MKRSRGELQFCRLFTVRDMGIGNSEPHVDRVIDTFLGIGEGVAVRWIQMPRAILLLQMAPDNAASGAVYVYDRELQEFYMVSFEGADDSLTLEEFSELKDEYDLLKYAEQPQLLRTQVQCAAAA